MASGNPFLYIYTSHMKGLIQNFLILFIMNKKTHVKRLIDFLVFNATFSNISAKSWRPVLVMEEAGVPGENHRPWASNW
jgi:hypothetical protein